jgi:hypothetical protein
MPKKIKFKGRKKKIQPIGKLQNDVTVYLASTPFQMKGEWYVKITTTTSGYYRDFLYKQVGER